MEQVFKNYDKDGLKMAMLKHEETFRQQVHDLHRLYKIQKLLMRDLKRELKSQKNLSSSSALLDVCSYEQWYGATRGSHAATPRTALSLDVVQAAVDQYPQSAGETDDGGGETELELTLAVGSSGGARKRYGNEHHYSPGGSFSSSSTESDVLTGGRGWPAHQLPGSNGVSSPWPPYHKRRPAAGFDVLQVEDGGVQPPPLLFHWLSLKMA